MVDLQDPGGISGGAGRRWPAVRQLGGHAVRSAGRIRSRDPIRGRAHRGESGRRARGRVSMYGDMGAIGELFDRPVTPSDDVGACQNLMEEAAPLTATLRQNLYPNIEQRPEIQQPCVAAAAWTARGLAAGGVFGDGLPALPDPRSGRSAGIAGAGDHAATAPARSTRSRCGWSSCCRPPTCSPPPGASRCSPPSTTATSGQAFKDPLVQWMYHPRKSIARRPPGRRAERRHAARHRHRRAERRPVHRVHHGRGPPGPRAATP